MTLPEFIRLTHAKGRHPKWRAICPVHTTTGSRHAAKTLAIFADKGKIGVHCFAGCDKDAILEALGLSWKDLLEEKEWLPSEEYKKAVEARKKEEAKAYRARIRSWVRLFREEGYKTLERDTEAVVAIAQLMVVRGEQPHLQKLLATHMERITASQYI